MITLEKLNIQESDLDTVLNFVCETEYPESAVNYVKFIKEDATLDQKLSLLQKEGVNSAVDLASKLIKITTKKCKASCNEDTIVWNRMKNTAQCHADEAIKMVEFVKNTSGDEILIGEWTHKLKLAQAKVLEYEAKFEKLV